MTTPDPREKRCATCQGPNAHCGIAGQWFCRRCVPADWAPVSRPAEKGREGGKVGG